MCIRMWQSVVYLLGENDYEKMWYLLTLVLCMGFLVACHVETGKDGISTETKHLEASDPVEREPMSEQDVMALFYQHRDRLEVNIIDCVVVSESNYGILGVVQYTTEDYDGCMFDFLTNDVPLSAGVGASPAETGSLEYLGEDTVSCQLVKENGVPQTYKVSFYRSDIEYGFKVVSE